MLAKREPTSLFDVPSLFDFGTRNTRQSIGYSSNVTKPSITDEEDEKIIEVPVPGFTKDDVHVDVRNGTLEVQARQGGDERSVDFRIGIQEDAYEITEAEATIEHGLLSVHIPKKTEEARQETSAIPIH